MILEIIILSLGVLIISASFQHGAIVLNVKNINKLKQRIRQLEDTISAKNIAINHLLDDNKTLNEINNSYKEDFEALDKKIQRLKSQFRGNKEFQKILKILKK